jgi:hypothetical protein
VQQCSGRIVLSSGNIFSIAVDQDGYLECNVGGAIVKSNDPIPVDAWTHAALSYDKATIIHCAVNGVPQGKKCPPGQICPPVSAPLAGSPILSTIRLGQSLAPPDQGVDVDEVRLIAAARSDAEILEDALRPLNVGPPRGNVVHIDFAHPIASFTPAPGATPGDACSANSQPNLLCYTDQSKAGNNAKLIEGQIVPGVEGMVFDTVVGRPASSEATQVPANGQVAIPHSITLS